MMYLPMEPLDSITRIVKIPYKDDKPKRHKWYLYLAKVGTTNGTVVWVADKDFLEEGDHIYFVDDCFYPMKDKTRCVKYPSDTYMHRGVVTNINNEPRAFISLV